MIDDERSRRWMTLVAYYRAGDGERAGAILADLRSCAFDPADLDGLFVGELKTLLHRLPRDHWCQRVRIVAYLHWARRTRHRAAAPQDPVVPWREEGF